jgi:hypothetical protein
MVTFGPIATTRRGTRSTMSSGTCKFRSSANGGDSTYLRNVEVAVRVGSSPLGAPGIFPDQTCVLERPRFTVRDRENPAVPVRSVTERARGGHNDYGPAAVSFRCWRRVARIVPGSAETKRCPESGILTLVREHIIDGRRWIDARLLVLRERLEEGPPDDERRAIESEIDALSKEPGLTCSGFKVPRQWVPRSRGRRVRDQL